jgi:hypothetical protein
LGLGELVMLMELTVALLELLLLVEVLVEEMLITHRDLKVVLVVEELM